MKLKYKILISILFVFFTNCSFAQRDPNPRKDFANVFYNKHYTLYDFWSDEPIYSDKFNIYNIYYSTNEDKTQHKLDISKEGLVAFKVYKFKNLANCRNWCNQIPYKRNVQ